MNKVTFIGRMVKDIEIATTAGGATVGKFTLAVNRRFKREGQPEADFFKVTVWNKIAENMAKYTSKGSQIGVSGRIEIDTYEKDGVKHYVTNVIGEEIEFLGGKSGNVTQNNTNSTNNTNDGFDGAWSESGEDIPF